MHSTNTLAVALLAGWRRSEINLILPCLTSSYTENWANVTTEGRAHGELSDLPDVIPLKLLSRGIHPWNAQSNSRSLGQLLGGPTTLQNPEQLLLPRSPKMLQNPDLPLLSHRRQLIILFSGSCLLFLGCYQLICTFSHSSVKVQDLFYRASCCLFPGKTSVLLYTG